MTALDFGGNSSGRITLSMQNFNSYSLFLCELTFGCHFVEQSEKEGYILQLIFFFLIYILLQLVQPTEQKYKWVRAQE